MQEFPDTDARLSRLHQQALKGDGIVIKWTLAHFPEQTPEKIEHNKMGINMTVILHNFTSDYIFCFQLRYHMLIPFKMHFSL